MKRVVGGLYWKLSSVFLILLTLVGAAYTYLTLYSSEMYFAETSQRLNAALAGHIVEGVQPFLANGQPNVGAMNSLFHDVMVVNPSIEIYLLDATGRILTYDAPKGKVKLAAVSMRPIKEFIESGGKQLILGDNPRDIGRPKVFSAAPVSVNKRTFGYIYVILSGEEFDSIADRILSSHILSLGFRGLLLSLAGAGAVGLIALALITTKLRRLTRTVLAFKGGDYRQRFHPTSDDELDELGRAFNAMADAIADHVKDLQRTDALRRELVANVSHDLRTPLASIQGYLETVLMKDCDLSPEERRRYLEVIFGSTERLGKLVQELFELSKLEAKETQPRAEPFSLPDLVNDLAGKFAPLADRKGVKIATQFSPPLPLASADIGMIDRVLQNLLDNAIAHTPRGGEVRINLRLNNDKICVEVEGTGAGISEGDLPLVFDRFYQSRRKSGGSGAGLGLAIVRKILEAHGEPISVESVVNEGTRFVFELPTASSTMLAVG